ncbi:PE family protein [Mycobacterium kansasii 732]|nr:PE family protein [Mycobacterium kansasii 732]
MSVAIAAVFGKYAQTYQTLNGQALAFQDQFVRALSLGAGAYASAEAANASPLQAVLNEVNTTIQSVIGRPLIGNGPNGSPGSEADGGPGGILIGNGGAGGSGAPGLPGGNGGPPDCSAPEGQRRWRAVRGRRQRR